MYLVPLSALPSIQPLETVNQEPGAALKQQEGKSSFANIMREAIDTLRRIQREHLSMSLEELEMEIPKEDMALQKLTEQELSKETEEILKCLSGRDQELFRRIFLMEEEPEEAGQALGMSRDNVYVRIFRGKKKIRSKFGERKRA